MRRVIAGFVLLVTGLLFALPANGQESPSPVEVRQFDIDLGADFVTHAELTLPTGDSAPFPLVILLHGSGPYDMDATVSTPEGEVLSANFRRIAESLAANGIAALRFNKRGVLGDGAYDFAQIQASDLDRLTADATTVFETARTLTDIDPDAIYLYGWSEGAVVASNVAANLGDTVAGLILQGSPNGNISTVLQYQHIELGLEYLHTITDINNDNLLSLDEIAAIPPVSGAVSLMPAFYLYDYTSTPQNPLINSYTDSNGDGMIAIDDELRPTIEMFIANYDQFVTQTDASWAVGELLAQSGIPTLVLHGSMDGWVPVETAAELHEAASQSVTVSIYDGLGHALSPTDDRALDSFRDIDQAPLDDIAAWINAR